MVDTHRGRWLLKRRAPARLRHCQLCMHSRHKYKQTKQDLSALGSSSFNPTSNERRIEHRQNLRFELIATFGGHRREPHDTLLPVGTSPHLNRLLWKWAQHDIDKGSYVHVYVRNRHNTQNRRADAHAHILPHSVRTDSATVHRPAPPRPEIMRTNTTTQDLPATSIGASESQGGQTLHWNGNGNTSDVRVDKKNCPERHCTILEVAEEAAIIENRAGRRRFAGADSARAARPDVH